MDKAQEASFDPEIGRRTITAKITLEEDIGRSEYGSREEREIVSSNLTISLPVPSVLEAERYISRQIAGLLRVAGEIPEQKIADHLGTFLDEPGANQARRPDVEQAGIAPEQQ